MNAILYVAGRATRLGGHTRDHNKVLLEFGSQSLLERHVMLLARVGVPKLFVVTGYLQEQLQAAMPALQSRYGLEIEELYNADFTEGSVLSLHTSLPVSRIIPRRRAAHGWRRAIRWPNVGATTHLAASHSAPCGSGLFHRG